MTSKVDSPLYYSTIQPKGEQTMIRVEFYIQIPWPPRFPKTLAFSQDFVTYDEARLFKNHLEEKGIKTICFDIISKHIDLDKTNDQLNSESKK